VKSWILGSADRATYHSRQGSWSSVPDPQNPRHLYARFDEMLRAVAIKPQQAPAHPWWRGFSHGLQAAPPQGVADGLPRQHCGWGGGSVAGGAVAGEVLGGKVVRATRTTEDLVW